MRRITNPNSVLYGFWTDKPDHTRARRTEHERVDVGGILLGRIRRATDLDADALAILDGAVSRVVDAHEDIDRRLGD